MRPVLEVGGTHVSAALVDDDWRVHDHVRLPVDADASAASIVARFADAGARVGAPARAVWGVAMPDPFDYERGIGQFEGVGKFTALRGVDVGDLLARSLRPPPADIVFLNDADAFVLGEWTAGAARGVARVAGLTLGTGVGSGWLVDGRVSYPAGVPGGRLHRLDIGGRPLEDTVSRRAIRAAYGDPGVDVREIAERARAGDSRARRVMDDAFVPLGRVLGRALAGFRAELLVVGGSIAGAWDLIAPALRVGAQGDGLPAMVLAQRPDDAALVGTAAYAERVAARR